MMNEYLAGLYGTNGATDEDAEKVAQAELFSKLAADNGIDLNQLSDDQIAQLWDQTFEKEAEEKCPDCNKADCECGDEKTSAAEYEFFEKKAFQEKLAEADYMGRVMAHAYVNELNAIGDDMDKEGSYARSAKFHARRAWEGAKKKGREYWDVARHGTGTKEYGHKYRSAKARVKTRELRGVTGSKMEAAREQLRRARGQYAKAIGKRGLAIGAPVAAVGGGAGAAYAATRDKKKKASAIDEIAAEVAFDKVAEQGWDVEEAADLLNSALTLGVEETEKVASADSFDEAVDVRALELLEAVGYPVTWNE